MAAARRSVLRAPASALAAGPLLFGSAGPAHADDLPPGCTTADMTGVMSGISAAMSAHLSINPDVRADLEAVRQPSRDFRARCNLPQRALILAENL